MVNRSFTAAAVHEVPLFAAPPRDLALLVPDAASIHRSGMPRHHVRSRSVRFLRPFVLGLLLLAAPAAVGAGVAQAAPAVLTGGSQGAAAAAAPAAATEPRI